LNDEIPEINEILTFCPAIDALDVVVDRSLALRYITVPRNTSRGLAAASSVGWLNGSGPLDRPCPYPDLLLMGWSSKPDPDSSLVQAIAWAGISSSTPSSQRIHALTPSGTAGVETDS
jgi:hypothetical protein